MMGRNERRKEVAPSFGKGNNNNNKIKRFSGR